MTEAAVAEEKEPQPSRLDFASLPSIEQLEETTRLRVAQLLQALDDSTAMLAAMEADVTDCLAELVALQADTKQPGFRHGQLVFASQECKGKRSLNAMKLIEAGVPAKTIAECYVTGKPSTRKTFKRLAAE